jgi:hypothetical protein
MSEQAFLVRLLGKGAKKLPDPRTRTPIARPGSLDLGDIQGFVVRGYRMPLVRHFSLTVTNAASARGLLGRLINGDESNAPQITTAEDWHVGFEPGPHDDLQAAPAANPIIA